MKSNENKSQKKHPFQHKQIETYWSRVLPHSSGMSSPKIQSLHLNRRYQRSLLPLNPSICVGSIYARRMLRNQISERKAGQVMVRSSKRFVSTRKLKKGDAVSMSWVVKNSKSSEQRVNSLGVLSGSLISRGKKKTQFDVSLGTPRKLPYLRDHYDAYHPLGPMTTVGVGIVMKPNLGHMNQAIQKQAFRAWLRFRKV